VAGLVGLRFSVRGLRTLSADLDLRSGVSGQPDERHESGLDVARGALDREDSLSSVDGRMWAAEPGARCPFDVYVGAVHVCGVERNDKRPSGLGII
jgi:hypothetical protein